MFLFFTGAIDIAYVGITPYVLGRSYGLPVRVVGIAQEYGPSHAVLVRPEKAGDDVLKIGTVLGSDAHRLVSAWSRTTGQKVSLVNLSPSDQLKALEYGFIDGVSVWEPQVSLAQQLGARRVYSTDDSGVAGYNLLCATDSAIAAKSDLLDRFISAHYAAVDLISQGDLDSYQDFLQGVFDSRLSSGAYVDLLRSGYRWPQVSIRVASDAPAELRQSLDTTHEFLGSVGLLTGQPIDPETWFPSSWPPPDTSRDRRLAIGYSDSLMSAAFHLAQGTGLLADRRFVVDSDQRRLVERIASLDHEFRPDLHSVEPLISTDAELAVMKLGRVNEDIFTSVYSLATGKQPPRQLSKTLALLEEHELVPNTILSSAHWIRSVRNIAAHEEGVSRTHARSCYSHMVDILEWFCNERALLTSKRHRCLRCQKALRPEWSACPYCGVRQPTECAQCGQALEAGWKACPFCATSAL